MISPACRQLASTEPAGEINRTGKADRAALKAAQSQTETITIRNVGLDDTSVVVRVPVAPRRRGTARRCRPGPRLEARRIEDGDRLRTAGQRIDRGRQTAPTRPLRDLRSRGG